ncbi:uncharacterized protein LOC143031241 [Oratosquilla oratoria]|uniref:uncharacterized protein LOC143031241 n=1 Tax=Oratosquilla oratoria TaxID=337810 RepID=UPI003F759FD9
MATSLDENVGENINCQHKDSSTPVGIENYVQEFTSQEKGSQVTYPATGSTSLGKIFRTNATNKGVSKSHPKTENNKKSYKCKYCDAVFSKVWPLNRHLRIHTRENIHKCTLCNAIFSEAGHLEGHIRTHTGERPFKCKQCLASFSQKGTLNHHMRTHTGERPYKCTFCDASFSFAGNLKVHIRKHTGDTPHKCTICNAAFSEMGNLKIHIRSHTGEKPYKCAVCETSFSQKATLKYHTRTHTGERPYRCATCDAAFSNSSHLKCHMRAHSSEHTYDSSLCSAAFPDKASLKCPVRINTETPYQCSHCNAVFCQRQKLINHLRIHEVPSNTKDSIVLSSNTNLNNVNLDQSGSKNDSGTKDFDPIISCNPLSFLSFTSKMDVKEHHLEDEVSEYESIIKEYSVEDIFTTLV